MSTQAGWHIADGEDELHGWVENFQPVSIRCCSNDLMTLEGKCLTSERPARAADIWIKTI